jgi:hypothetical protein
MRRVLSQMIMAAVLAAAFLAAPLGLSAAVAAPAASTTAAAACPHPRPYPPSPDATVESSTTTPLIGQRIKVSGINYCPTENVDITLRGVHVGSAFTTSSGSFDPEITVTGPAGAARLCGIGASGLATDRDCLVLHVRASNGQGSSSTPVSGSGGGGGGTAFTGTDLALLIAIAVLLIAGGIAFATAGRGRVVAQPTEQ